MGETNSGGTSVILVTGATGTVGREVVAQLLAFRTQADRRSPFPLANILIGKLQLSGSLSPSELSDGRNSEFASVSSPACFLYVPLTDSRSAWPGGNT